MSFNGPYQSLAKQVSDNLTKVTREAKLSWLAKEIHVLSREAFDLGCPGLAGELLNAAHKAEMKAREQ